MDEEESTGISFEGEERLSESVATEEPTGISGFLVRKGIVRNSKQAGVLLLIAAVVIIAAAFMIPRFMTHTNTLPPQSVINASLQQRH